MFEKFWSFLKGLRRASVVEGKRVPGAASFGTGELSIFTDRLSADTLRLYYRESSVIRDCVDKIALTIADVPFVIETKVGDPNKIKERLFGKAPTGETFRDVLVAAITDLLVLDKCVILPVFTTGGALAGFVSRDAATFYPIRDESGVLKGYLQRMTYPKSYLEKFDPSEVIFVKGFPKTYTASGTPIIEGLTYEIAAMVQSMLRLSSKAQGGSDSIPPGVLVFENLLGEEVLDRLQADLTSLAKGESGAKVPIAWGAGKALWVQIARELISQELVSLFDKFDWLVRKAFGYLPAGTALSAPAGGQVYPYSALVPHIAKALESHFNSFLWRFGVQIRFRVLPPITLNELLASLRAGLISPNDARRFIGFPPVKGGDQLTILNPQGLTPIGAPGLPGPLEIPLPQSVPEKAEETQESVTRKMTEEEAQKVRNLSLLEDERVARFVKKRIELVQKYEKKTKELFRRFRNEFAERVALRRAVPSYVALYDQILSNLDAIFDEAKDEALTLGYDYASHWWSPGSYPRDDVQKEIDEAIKYFKENIMSKWEGRFSELHRHAEKAEWERVEDDLKRLSMSLMFGMGLAIAISLFPLIHIARYFDLLAGRDTRVKWIGILDGHTCYSEDTYVLTDQGWKLFKDLDAVSYTHLTLPTTPYV